MISSSISSVAVILILLTGTATAFSWKSCRGDFDQDVIQVQQLKVIPDVLSLDGPVTLSITVDVKRNISGPLRVQTHMEKISGLLQGQTIPCQGKFGSCTFVDVCSEFANLCPIGAGLHTVPSYVLKLPKMSAFVRWMAEGAYSGMITVNDNRGNQLACISLSMNVAS